MTFLLTILCLRWAILINLLVDNSSRCKYFVYILFDAYVVYTYIERERQSEREERFHLLPENCFNDMKLLVAMMWI